MLFLLSPAKSLDFERPISAGAPRRPAFVAESTELIELLRTLSAAEIAALMEISPALANSMSIAMPPGGRASPRATAARRCWHSTAMSMAASMRDARRCRPRMGRPPSGDPVGPLRRAAPARCIAGLSPRDGHGACQSAWRQPACLLGRSLADYLNRRARPSTVPVIVNLASQEYFGGVRRAAAEAARHRLCLRGLEGRATRSSAFSPSGHAG